jgi:hypothetical protein
MAKDDKPSPSSQAINFEADAAVRNLGADLEHTGAVSLTGFVGPSKNPDNVRLYADLSFTSYLEIPKGTVLGRTRVRQDDENSPSLLRVRSDAKLEYRSVVAHSIEASALAGAITAAHMRTAVFQRTAIMPAPTAAVVADFTNTCFSCNPCATNTCVSCNPCVTNTCVSCNPCVTNTCASCNPCVTNTCASCNPCVTNTCASCNPCVTNTCVSCNPCVTNTCVSCNPCVTNNTACCTNTCVSCNPCVTNTCVSCNPCIAIQGGTDAACASGVFCSDFYCPSQDCPGTQDCPPSQDCPAPADTSDCGMRSRPRQTFAAGRARAAVGRRSFAGMVAPTFACPPTDFRICNPPNTTEPWACPWTSIVCR